MEKEIVKLNKEITYVKIERIVSNKNQPRKIFDENKIIELSNSIRENGIIQPITLRYNYDNMLELVAGERRVVACRRLGLTHIPAIIVDISEEMSAIMAIIENIQRQNLNFIEEAKSYETILEFQNMTQEELAIKLGKTQSSVANKLRLLKLSDDITDIILKNDITERHARALLKLKSEYQQKEVLEMIITKSLNVAQTETIIEDIIKEQKNIEVQHNTRIKRSFKDIRFLTKQIDGVIKFMNVTDEIAKYDVVKKDNKYQIIIDVDLAKSSKKATRTTLKEEIKKVE